MSQKADAGLKTLPRELNVVQLRMVPQEYKVELFFELKSAKRVLLADRQAIVNIKSAFCQKFGHQETMPLAQSSRLCSRA